MKFINAQATLSKYSDHIDTVQQFLTSICATARANDTQEYLLKLEAIKGDFNNQQLKQISGKFPLEPFSDISTIASLVQLANAITFANFITTKLAHAFGEDDSGGISIFFLYQLISLVVLDI